MKLNNNDDSHNSGLNLLIYNMLLDIESHPAWVCGLKQYSTNLSLSRVVTPCVGVWIETLAGNAIGASSQSHPAWVCGLKPPYIVNSLDGLGVTPCVGVWIETNRFKALCRLTVVTPCVGVWIETQGDTGTPGAQGGTPCVGVWIETAMAARSMRLYRVTPCVGVWIETLADTLKYTVTSSHPAWVCGLKHSVLK